jgi:SAM-dependent methyltransferase
LQYLATGIDSGRGYQACAASALSAVLETQTVSYLKPPVLDIGCAVGVLGGILGIDDITGIDLFVELLQTAVLVDTFSGRKNHYLTADMTRDWPVSRVYGTILCGLVCHHLKTQSDIVRFFMNANRALSTGGSLIITLPAGTVATVEKLISLTRGIESFGFRIEPATTGLIRSADDPHSLFWMFLITAIRETQPRTDTFISPSFSFPDFRTPITRVEKGDRARLTVQEERQVSHNQFRLIPFETLFSVSNSLPLIYEEVNDL